MSRRVAPIKIEPSIEAREPVSVNSYGDIVLRFLMRSVYCKGGK
jgi:hypothetical protein